MTLLKNKRWITILPDILSYNKKKLILNLCKWKQVSFIDDDLPLLFQFKYRNGRSHEKSGITRCGVDSWRTKSLIGSLQKCYRSSTCFMENHFIDWTKGRKQGIVSVHFVLAIHLHFYTIIRTISGLKIANYYRLFQHYSYKKTFFFLIFLFTSGRRRKNRNDQKLSWSSGERIAWHLFRYFKCFGKTFDSVCWYRRK